MTDYSASPTTLRRLANNMRVQQDFIEVEYELFDAIADKWDKDRAAVRDLRAVLELKTLDHVVALAKQADCLARAERAEAALEQARALVPADVFECVSKRGYALCGCGKDHCSWCTFPEWAHKLAALLSPAAKGGAA